MARKRMFDLDVINQDSFFDLPMEAKALYFLMGMEADDEGFVSPRKILKLYGGTEDSLRVLAAKGYIIPFKTGVIVITDWKRNNYIQKDRLKPTIYQEEKAQLEYDNETQKYVCLTNVKQMLNNGLTNVNIDKNRIDKNRIDKNSIDKKKENNKKKKKYFENEEVNNIFIEFLELRKKLRVVNTDRAINLLINKLNKYDDNIKIKMLEQSIMNSWKSVYELKNKEDITPTWFNEEKEEKEEKSDEEYEQFLKNIGRSN